MLAQRFGLRKRERITLLKPARLGRTDARPLPPGVGSPAAAPTQERVEASDTQVTVRFKIPRHCRNGRRPAYLSPSTGSIVLSVFDAGHVKRLVQHTTSVGINITIEAIPGGSVVNPIYAHATLSIDP